ncbi:hypothetical protein BHM03_00038888 [Ensete ventricosum]|nr:hypothetical protein BHM03_00038888 [Ensete ventricosum]
MSQERQELLDNSREPPARELMYQTSILHGWEHFFPNPRYVLEIVQRPRALALWWGNGIADRLPENCPWTCAVGLRIDDNHPNCHPSHSSSVLRPSACITDPSTASLAPGVGPASSASGTLYASSLVIMVLDRATSDDYPGDAPQKALVAGKREDHKRHCTENSQSQPSKIIRRCLDVLPKASSTSPKFYSTSPKFYLDQNLPSNKEKGLVRTPNPLKGPRELVAGKREDHKSGRR